MFPKLLERAARLFPTTAFQIEERTAVLVVLLSLDSSQLLSSQQLSKSAREQRSSEAAADFLKRITKSGKRAALVCGRYRAPRAPTRKVMSSISRKEC